MKIEYRKALTEVNEIINYADEEVKQKIPEKFKQYIKDNMDKNHKVDIDTNKEMIEQNISEEAKDILAIIYRDYLCTKEQRQELILKEKEKIENEKKEKYKIDFEKKKQDKLEKSQDIKINIETALTETKETKWYKKIIQKILTFFRKK